MRNKHCLHGTFRGVFGETPDTADEDVRAPSGYFEHLASSTEGASLKEVLAFPFTCVIVPLLRRSCALLFEIGVGRVAIRLR
jgi:hypothetical protein